MPFCVPLLCCCLLCRRAGHQVQQRRVEAVCPAGSGAAGHDTAGAHCACTPSQKSRQDVPWTGIHSIGTYTIRRCRRHRPSCAVQWPCHPPPLPTQAGPHRGAAAQPGRECRHYAGPHCLDVPGAAGPPRCRLPGALVRLAGAALQPSPCFGPPSRRSRSQRTSRDGVAKAPPGSRTRSRATGPALTRHWPPPTPPPPPPPSPGVPLCAASVTTLRRSTPSWGSARCCASTRRCGRPALPQSSNVPVAGLLAARTSAAGCSRCCWRCSLAW